MGRVKMMIIEWTVPMMSILYMVSLLSLWALYMDRVSLCSPCIFSFINKSRSVMFAPASYNCDHEFSPAEGNSVCSTKWPSNVPGFLPLLRNSAQR